MSRKIRKAVASTLALAMMAGNVSSMPAGQLASIVQAAEAGATVSVKAPTEVKAGETFTVECNISDNADGFTALVAWINFNKDVFEKTKKNIILMHMMTNVKAYVLLKHWFFILKL